MSQRKESRVKWLEEKYKVIKMDHAAVASDCGGVEHEVVSEIVNNVLPP